MTTRTKLHLNCKVAQTLLQYLPLGLQLASFPVPLSFVRAGALHPPVHSFQVATFPEHASVLIIDKHRERQVSFKEAEKVKGRSQLARLGKNPCQRTWKGYC